MAIFTGLIAAVSGFFSAVAATTVGAFVLNTIASIGLSALAKALAGKKQAQVNLGVQGALSRGADIPQSFIFGNYATAGALNYTNTVTVDGHPNVGLYSVITLSDLPVKGILGVFVNGVWQPFTPPASPDGWYIFDNFVKPDGQYLRFKFHDGTQTTADSDVIAAGTTERPWDSSAIGTGRAYVVMYSHVTEGFFQNGFPTYLFEVQGVPMYNPAADTSVGGSGDHRWDDPSTWWPSDNPAVVLYNILRGIYHDGEWVYGLQGVTAAQLPAAHWIGQIEKCETLVASAAGTEEQFKASGEIPVNAEIVTVIEGLLTACNGRLSDAGGVYKLFAGEADAAVMSITDDDILSTSEQTFTPFFGLADTVNGIAGKYPYPQATWQIEAAPPLYVPEYEAADGGRRLLANVSFDFVPHPEQVQRLMKAALNEARRARRHTIMLPPKFWPLEPGDVIAWTSERNGYEAKLFRIDGMIDHGNADVTLDITEVDPADYDFNSAIDYTAPAITSGVYQPIPVQGVDSFAVTAATLADTGGVIRAVAIKATWNGDTPDVAAIKIETRVKADGQAVAPTRVDNVALGETYISDGIFALTTYQCRAEFIPNGLRPTEWTDWLDVTTGDVKIEPDYISDAVWDLIEGDAIGWADKMLRDDPRIAELTQNALNDLEDLLNSYNERKLIKSDVATVTETLTTEIIAGQTALASLETTLTAQINNNLAEINNEKLVRASQTSANASDITTLYSNVSDLEGSVAGQAGAISSLSTAVSVVDGKTTVNAAQLTALTARVGSAESGLAGQADAIDELFTDATALNGVVNVQAGKITSLTTTVGAHTTTISSHTSSLNGLSAEYVLKINNNGIVSGMSLRSSASEGSEVAFMADRFAITNGPDQAQRRAPFIVYTSPTTVDGVAVAAGVYMRDAFIRDAAVTTLKIKGSAVTVPSVDTRTSSIPGDGLTFADWVTVNETTVVFDFPGYLMVNWSGQHGYVAADYTASFPHSFRFVVGFATVFERAADALNDYPGGAWMGYQSAGSYTVKVQWRGSAPIGSRTISLNSRTLCVMGVKR